MTKTPAPSINVRGSRNDSLSKLCKIKQSLAYDLSNLSSLLCQIHFLQVSTLQKTMVDPHDDSSLSAGELRRRYNVKDNNKTWAATSAPGVKVGDDGGSMMVVGLVAVMLVIAVVAFLLRG